MQKEINDLRHQLEADVHETASAPIDPSVVTTVSPRQEDLARISSLESAPLEFAALNVTRGNVLNHIPLTSPAKSTTPRSLEGFLMEAPKINDCIDRYVSLIPVSSDFESQ